MYVVHANQAAAIERAQALVNLNVTTRPQREAIAAAMAGVRMGRGFGDTLDRLVRNGVGVHHAGMLPRYRRLVERLAGQGLLPVICGTDTLGVGVNIPIRTVLMTALTKFDGTRVRRFTVREFHQLAGRAGRPGFDPDGHVWVQAPDHVIENARALAQAGDDPEGPAQGDQGGADAGGLRPLRRGRDAAPRDGPARSARVAVPRHGRPRGRRAVPSGRPGRAEAPPAHQPRPRRAGGSTSAGRSRSTAASRRQAWPSAGATSDGRCLGVRVGSLVEGEDERSALRFSSPLMTFAIEVIATLDREDPAYVVDVISVVESVLDDPRQVLHAQQNAARAAEIARLKAEGVPYEERIERLDSITWPKPLAELLDASFATYRQHHPWVTGRAVPEVDPARDAREWRQLRHVRPALPARAQRGTGAALPHRRVADARPLAARRRLHAGAGGRRRVARRADPGHRCHAARRVDPASPVAGPRPPGPRGARQAARPGRRLRGAPPCARRRSAGSSCWPPAPTRALAERSGWNEERLAEAMAPYWAEYDGIGIDADARSAAAVHARRGTRSLGRHPAARRSGR